MIKLIAIDLDGTLLAPDKSLPEENIRAIQEAVSAGIKVVLCTGRALPGTQPIFEALGLTDEYLIVNNGCSTYETSHWELIGEYHLTPEELTSLATIAREEDDVQLTVFDDKGHYYVIDEAPSELVTYDASLVFMTPITISSSELIRSNAIHFEAMFLAEESRLDSFQAKYDGTLSQAFSTVRSQSYIFEVMPKGATKASALKTLTEQLGILPEEVMALGDANNDIEMLTFAGTSVAMGNSPDHIKALTRYVTSSNADAGVARAIDRFALNKEL